jgi:hypothetical protein
VLAGDGVDVRHESESEPVADEVEVEPLPRQPFDLGPDAPERAAQQQQQQ